MNKLPEESMGYLLFNLQLTLKIDLPIFMKQKQKILEALKNKVPIWGYSPKGIADPSLSIRISQLGGVGLVDLESLSSSQYQKILETIKSSLTSDNLWGIRIHTQEALNRIDFNFVVPIVICAFSPNSQEIKKMQENSNLLLSEVCYLEEAYERAEWSDLFLVKGNEAGGMVGTKNSFILIQEFHKAGIPFIIQGGFGVYNICSAFMGGSLGVVLESQLYLFSACPISQEFKDYIKTINENDFYLILESSRYNYRLIGKLANKSIRAIREIEVKELSYLCEDINNTSGVLKSDLYRKVTEIEKKSLFYSDPNPKHSWLPSDHGISFANYILNTFSTLENFLDSISKIIQKQIERIQSNWPFVKNSEFAKLFNITYPIIQGPMANISDQIEFAKKIAENGALPIFALGGLLGIEAESLLSSAANSDLTEKPYGCGIIGLEVIKLRREEHLKSISKHGPALTLVAAGSIDLGVQIKKSGNTVLIHTPALSMFKDALKKNLDFIILEGNECGGHIGSLSSFVLWESILEYLDVNKKDTKKKVNIIFAGGIINELSTAMLASMIGTHLELINPGIQMGTAYLLTEEIITTQALSPVYQELLLNNSSTTIIGTSVNTRARVVPSEFACETIKNESARKTQGISISERKEMFEKDNLGALRIASRAEIWNDKHVEGTESTQYIPTSRAHQLTEGVFMTGDSISLQKTVRNISQIHYDVIEEGQNSFKMMSDQVLKLTLGRKPMTEEIKVEETLSYGNKVAVIGLGGIFPDAESIPQFWNNIINKKYSISEVPIERWDPAIYFDPDHSILDKTYSKIGGFVKKYEFKSIKYRIPPKMAQRMDLVQIWAIKTAEEALIDAGYPTNGKQRLPIAVIVGNSSGGDAQRLSNKRILFNEFKFRINEASTQKILKPDEKENLIQFLEESIIKHIPTINEDTMPGELANIIAGRVANVFNLTGKSMTTDAACASSLAAIDTAINGLLAKDYDTALVGGSDSSMDPQTYIKFSKIGALSEDGTYPFDARANGFIMGEGAGFIVLKRLEDAIEDQNKIYAIISGYGGSSDGKGKGITAPNPDGQRLAIERAIRSSNIQTSDIQYLECHGTSTVVGDATELNVLGELFSNRKSDQKFAIGSIKSQIGHLKSAAGIAGIIKTVLALHHKILPPSINYVTPNPSINWDTSPYYVNTEAKKWISPQTGIRRAGVSSFGFGGTNYHVILEEFLPQLYNVSSLEGIKDEIPTQVPDSIPVKPPTELCFLFSGQGSQYVGMMKELYQKFQVVKNTLDNAQEICKKFADFDLLEIIFGSSNLTDEENSNKLRQTEFTQPAIYSVEIALVNLLKSEGIKPGIVGGHSLGEFAALTTAGVLSFEDALKVVITRGRAMSELLSGVQCSMAAIFTSSDIVENTLKEISIKDVSISNYNSTSQTVISGELSAIEKAVKIFSEKEIRALKLNVSTAFHSKFVAHAEEKLKKFLKSIEFKSPQIPVFSNVTGDVYSENPEEIKTILLKQITSPVRWVDEAKNIYQHGGKKFVEIGPKKALFWFTKDILKQHKEIEVDFTLSPKSSEEEQILKIIEKFKPSKSISSHGAIKIPIPSHKMLKPREKVIVSKALAKQEIDISNDELNKIRQLPFFNEFLEEQKELLTSVLIQGFQDYLKKYQPSLESQHATKAIKVSEAPVVITGVGIGLPGKNRKVFDDKNIDDILRGENLIEPVSNEYRDQLYRKNIIRLEKSPNGNAKFTQIDDVSKVIHLAGQMGEFNPTEDYHIDSKMLSALDISFQLAISAGYEALKDAGIPLVRSYITTSTGKVLPSEWVFPEHLQDDTGIIFASAFPGYDNFAEEISADNKEFNRAFLFRVLSMGHSQFAQMIKARGPNTSINGACASTPQAMGIAEDWIRTGRCKRVIIITGDNVTSKNLFQWIGAGFLASGAATIKSQWEEAVLPFGEGRNGIILGAGASAFVVEQGSEAKARGVKPIVELLGSYFANSAFHGSRLDRVHISQKLTEFVNEMGKRYGITKNELANEGMFVSHETYSPARGGSAEAELDALEKTFGEKAYDMMIINTKGYTGHAMGAGIEEAVAIKSMEKGIIPPIANLTRIDPNYAKFNFSKGSNERKKYALRFAAGFGSQLAMVLFRLASFDNRFNDPNYEQWLQNIGGSGNDVFIDGRVLKMNTKRVSSVKSTFLSPKSTGLTQLPPLSSTGNILSEVKHIIAMKTGYDPEDIEEEYDLEEDLGIDTVKQAEIFGEIREKWKIEVDDSFNIADYPTIKAIILMLHDLGVSDISSEKAQIPGKVSTKGTNDIIIQIKQIISTKTGYDPEDIEENYDLEEDLGIDTVKQAEIFGEIREKWNLEVDDSFNIADYPTINAIISMLSEFLDSDLVTSKNIPSKNEKLLENKLLEIISEKTGYDIEDIDIKYDLEEDLGIDTVKQAEIFGELRDYLKISEDTEINLAGLKSIQEVIQKIHEYLVDPDLNTFQETTDMEIGKPSNINQVKNMIKKVIAEKTGYEIIDIEDSYDLEEDLGIDTVKQAEIFGELRAFYSLEETIEINITEIRTPNEITEFIMQFVHKTSTLPEDKLETSHVEDQSPEKLKKEEEEIYISQVVPSRIFNLAQSKSDPKFKDTKAIIINLNSGLSNFQNLQEDLNKFGLNTQIFDIEGKEDFAESLKNKESEKLHEIDFNIIFLVVPDSTQYSSNESLAFFDRLFIIFQSMNLTDVEKVVVIAPEPFFGWENGANPLSASIGAFVKTLNREFQIPIKLIYSLNPKQIIDEIITWDDVEEVAYKDGIRYTLLKTKLGGIPEQKEYSITKEDVLLATGGAQGITFACIDELTNNVDPQLILLGLAPYDDSLYEYISHTPEMLEEKKKELTSLLKSKQERVTPVMIKREWKNFLDKLDTLRNIESLKKKGLKVQYYAVDVTDEEKMKSTFQQIQENLEKPITIIVHGAGIEESKSFLKKNLKIAHKVVDVKVGGFLNLLKNIKVQDFKYIVAFSSVAGRYGNQGQIDYAFANAYLSRLAWDYSQRNIPFLSIDWTAWADIGMATQGSTLQILTQAGVVPVPAHIGVKIFSKLILNGSKGEYIVGGELGIFEEKLNIAKSINKLKYPMLNQITYQPNFIYGSNTLNSEFDTYLLDHQIQQKPVFPGVLVLETFAEFYNCVFDEPMNSISNVSFHTPLKVPINKSVEIELKYNYSNNEIALLSKTFPLVLKGKSLIKEHFKANLSKPMKKLRWRKELISEPLIPLLDKSEIYELFFHGSKFQVLKEIIQLENGKIISVVDIPTINLTKNSEGDNFQLDPLAIESIFQTAALFDVIINDHLSLPSKIATLEILSKEKPKYIVAKFLKKDEERSYYNSVILGENNEIIAKVGNLEIIHSPLSLNPSERLSNYLASLKEYYLLKNGKLSSNVHILPIEKIKLLYKLDNKLLETFLTENEIDGSKRFRNEKRKLEYFSGIIAAKECYLKNLSDNLTYNDIEIRKEEKGKPFYYSNRDKQEIPLNLSISHSHEFSVAVISKNQVGIDLELIEPRSPSFFKEVFTETEREFISEDEKLGTIYWTAKEAFSKAIGEGFNVNFRDFELKYDKKRKKFSLTTKKDESELNKKIKKLTLKSEFTEKYVLSYCEI
ncbi:MAG: SDR family NAD(P)-dependent oxidoreductase [Promethearchaeota archaeon]